MAALDELRDIEATRMVEEQARVQEQLKRDASELRARQAREQDMQRAAEEEARRRAEADVRARDAEAVQRIEMLRAELHAVTAERQRLHDRLVMAELDRPVSRKPSRAGRVMLLGSVATGTVVAAAVALLVPGRQPAPLATPVHMPIRALGAVVEPPAAAPRAAAPEVPIAVPQPAAPSPAHVTTKVHVRPTKVARPGGDEPIFDDNRCRHDPILCGISEDNNAPHGSRVRPHGARSTAQEFPELDPDL